MDFYKLFYFLTTADKFTDFLFTLSIVGSILSLIAIAVIMVVPDDKIFNFTWLVKDNTICKYTENELGHLIPSDKGQKYRLASEELWFARTRSASKYIPIITLIFWLLYVAIPSKKDALLIITGGYVGNFITQDSSAKQIPTDIVNFIRYNLKVAAEDAKIELTNLTNTKTLQDSLTEMTKDELINYINKQH